MHHIIQKLLEKDLKAIKKVLETECNTSEVDSKFDAVLTELVKINRPIPNSKLKISWYDAYWLVNDVVHIDEKNSLWHEAVADIGLLLEGSNVCYKEPDIPN